MSYFSQVRSTPDSGNVTKGPVRCIPGCSKIDRGNACSLTDLPRKSESFSNQLLVPNQHWNADILEVVKGGYYKNR